MAQEFDLIDFITSQTTPLKFDRGGPVQGFSPGGSVYALDPITGVATQQNTDTPKLRGVGKNVDFGRLDVTTQGGGGPWSMVPVAGGKGSQNDQVNKQGIIDAYLANLDDLGANLMGCLLYTSDAADE